jgi:hypothetical protein
MIQYNITLISRDLLEYCVANESYEGCPCPIEPRVLGAGFARPEEPLYDDMTVDTFMPAAWRILL